MNNSETKPIPSTNRNQPCQHYQLMQRYVEDAKTNTEPWLLWECKWDYETEWTTLKYHPLWLSQCQYRRKKTTVALGESIFPKPEQHCDLPFDTTYYVPELHGGIGEYVWKDSHINHDHMNSSMVHLSKRSAEQHATALRRMNTTACETHSKPQSCTNPSLSC